MNIVNKLTWRHMMKKKRQTLVTIIGVIISVAMITAVATLVVSFLELLQKQQIANEGEWHVLYKDVNEEQLLEIQDDQNTKKVVLSRDLGYSMLEGSANRYKPYLFVKEYNHEGFQQFPINLIEGRIPTKADELLISKHILTNGQVDLKVGDQLTLGIGERKIKEKFLPTTGETIVEEDELNAYELDQSFSLQTSESEEIIEEIDQKIEKEYTIVGIMERPGWERISAPGYTVLTYLNEDLFSEHETVNVSVVWKQINRKAVKGAEKLAENLMIDEVSFNNNLLRFYGVIHNDHVRKTLYSVGAIIMSIIMIGSISLIYNAFAISVSERSRHLGMLSSVGATKNQKRNSVFFEGLIIGCFSIPLGVLSGLAGVWITFYFVNPLIQDLSDLSEKLTIVITPISMLVAVLISALTIFISAYLPARRASKVSAIDAIRQTRDIKLTNKTVKTSKLVRKIFGIEAEFGLKNLKRNKRRYVVTVFSLVISIVLFLTVSFFIDQMKQSTEYMNSGLNYDLSIRSNENIFSEKLIHSITSMEEITGYSFINEIHLESHIDKNQAPEELKKFVEEDEQVSMSIDLKVLDDKTLRKYAKKVGVDYAELTDPDQMTGIIIHKARTIGGKYGETKAIHLKPGESLDLDYYDWFDDEVISLGELKVVALTEHLPMGVVPVEVGTLNIIVSQETFAQLNKDHHIKEGAYELFLTSTDPLGIHGKIEKLKDVRMHLYNHHKTRQEDNQFLLLISVFIYGFITLITAISVANIFNTISTSISLRTREFGMLKSVGMTPKGFNKMINYESIFYGIKSLLYGLPISFGIMYLIYHSMMGAFKYPFQIPWGSIIGTIIAVFLIVGSAMLYSSSKVKKENIIDALKQENI